MKTNKGFTLLEATLAMVMITIIMAVIFMALILSSQIFSGELLKSEVQHETSRGMERMAKELRGALEIVSSSSQDITVWWKDLNESSTRESEETLTFSWSGVEGDPLMRTISAETIILANYVTNFELTYDDPDDIKFATITLTSSKNNFTSTLESSIKFRNL